MIKIFLDTEFTGLNQNADLISLALVAETGEFFYGEFTDYDLDKATDLQWLLNNVIINLNLESTDSAYDLKKMRIKDTRAAIRSAIQIWLNQFGVEKDDNGEIIPNIQIWADVPHYDWVLFCELFGGARQVPKQIHFMPMDLVTYLFAKALDYKKERQKLINQDEIPKGVLHNALFDARLGMTVLKKYLKNE